MSDDSAPTLWEAALDFIFQDDTGQPHSGAEVQHFQLGPDSSVETDGLKYSQRAELAETRHSDDANAEGPVWYHWSVYIDPITENPSDGADGAKLHFGQFHQRAENGTSVAPALMFNLTQDGALVAQFESVIGKRSYVLVDGGPDGQAAKAQWIDIVVGADWRLDGGWTEFHVRQSGEDGFRLVAFDDGANTSTGQVYFKYGVYRSFLERDPLLADSVSSVYYSDVERSFDADDFFSDLPAEPTPLSVGTETELSTALPLDHFDFG